MEIREGLPADVDTIFMMGYDAWGEGASVQAYLEQCRSSTKYPQGTWYVLEEGGELLSSLIVYRQGFELPAGCWGVGSVATPPPQRRRGHAARLLAHVDGMAETASARAIYLFSGIDPAYYGKFGYEPVKVATPNPDAVCMARCFVDRDSLLQVVPTFF